MPRGALTKRRQHKARLAKAVAALGPSSGEGKALARVARQVARYALSLAESPATGRK